MRMNGKLEHLEVPGGHRYFDPVISFYSRIFGWSFTDYGPTYAAFSEGLDGGFDADNAVRPQPLPVLYAKNLEEAAERVTDAGGKIIKPIYSFPGGRRFHFTDPAGNELAVWSEK